MNPTDHLKLAGIALSEEKRLILENFYFNLVNGETSSSVMPPPIKKRITPTLVFLDKPSTTFDDKITELERRYGNNFQFESKEVEEEEEEEEEMYVPRQKTAHGETKRSAAAEEDDFDGYFESDEEDVNDFISVSDDYNFIDPAPGEKACSDEKEDKESLTSSLENRVIDLSMDTDTEDEKSFHPNTIETMEKMMLKFSEEDIRYILLFALMQSGKTSSYLFVAFEMLRLKIVKKVIIFTGNCEVDLKNQLKKDIHTVFYEYSRYLSEVKSIHLPNNHLTEQITVLWGTDLKNNIFDITNTLIIHDESHFGQSKNQQVDKFLTSNNLSSDKKAADYLANVNSFFVSVSATPFSETCNLMNEENIQKSIVIAEPGEGYRGVKQFDETDQIVYFKQDWEKVIQEVVEKTKESFPLPTYILIRLTNKKHAEKVAILARELGVDWGMYDSFTKKGGNGIIKSMEDLKSPPLLRHTIVVLVGMCRMGKTVCKKYVSAVMETGKNIKGDTLVQSLLGRVCGYEANQHLKIYLSEKNKFHVDEYITMVNEQLRFIPSCGMNVINNSKKRKLKLLKENSAATTTASATGEPNEKVCMHHLIPIEIEGKYFAGVTFDAKKKNDLTTILGIIESALTEKLNRLSLVDADASLPLTEYKKNVWRELLERARRGIQKKTPGAVIGCRDLICKTYEEKNFCAMILRGIEKEKATSLGKSGGASGPKLNVWEMPAGLAIEHNKTPGTRFITGKTQYCHPDDEVEWMNCDIPATTGKEIFK